jgi:hypothetical protein
VLTDLQSTLGCQLNFSLSLSLVGLSFRARTRALYMAKRRVGVEYSPSMLEPVRPGAVSPDRVLCLPTFSHFVIVNKTSLSLSLSLLHMAILVRIVHGCMNECVLSGAIDISQIHPHLSPPLPFPPSQAPSSSLPLILSTLHLRTPTRRQEKDEADIRQTVTKGVPPLAL